MSETMKSCGSRRSSSAGELQGSHRTILKELQETQQVLHLLTVLQAGGVRATRALGTHHPVPEASTELSWHEVPFTVTGDLVRDRLALLLL